MAKRLTVKKGKAGRWRDANGKFASPPTPRKRKKKKPSFSRNKILSEIVSRMKEDGLEIENTNTIEVEVTRETGKKETWHHFDVITSDAIEIEFIKYSFLNYFRPPLRPHYRKKTILRVLLGVEREGKDEENIIQSWRSISLTVQFKRAFSQLDFNLKRWLENAEYIAVFGFSAHVQK